MSGNTYNAIKSGFKTRGSFILDIADEIGWEKTLQVYSKRGDRRGVRYIEFLKTRPKDTRLKELGEAQLSNYNSNGWNIDANITETELEFIIHICPCFDGFQEAGIEVEKINALCKATHKGIDRQLKKVYPDASFTSVTKTSKESDCIERMTIPL